MLLAKTNRKNKIMATPAIINVMSRAAEKAARSLLRDFGEVENLQISIKGPGDFVSAADRKAEEIIHDELSYAKPNAGFLMEEGGEIKGKDNTRFIIDPLDGTTNFLHGIPHWCITIGYEEDGKITAGVVLDPVKDEMFYATKGNGAWMRGNKRLRVSGRKDMHMAVVVSNADPLDVFIPRYETVKPHVATIRNFGASALDLAYVAAGRIDGFYGGSIKQGPQPWDIAAASIIVKEAGGMITEIDGRSNPVFNQNVLAGNEQIYSQLKDLLK
jgi:myo-inositol-1(or 4)-monophosphatase